ncbi:MAG: MlaD family protein [Oceanidesulfovibrio sp.]
MAKKPLTRLIAGILCLLAVSGLAACDEVGIGSMCMPLISREVRVTMDQAMDLAVPSPVMLEGVQIGEVRSKDLMPDNQPVLKLCIEKGRLDNLRMMTIFYVDRSAAAPVLVAEPIADSGPLDAQAETLMFPGFSSYDKYVSWRTKNIIRQGVDEMLDAFDKLLGQDAEPQSPEPSSAPSSNGEPKTL